MLILPAIISVQSVLCNVLTGVLITDVVPIVTDKLLLDVELVSVYPIDSIVTVAVVYMLDDGSTVMTVLTCVLLLIVEVAGVEDRGITVGSKVVSDVVVM